MVNGKRQFIGLARSVSFESRIPLFAKIAAKLSEFLDRHQVAAITFMGQQNNSKRPELNPGRQTNSQEAKVGT
jgi:hypothetical protein